MLDLIDSNLAQYPFLATDGRKDMVGKVSFPMCVLCVASKSNFAISCVKLLKVDSRN